MSLWFNNHSLNHVVFNIHSTIADRTAMPEHTVAKGQWRVYEHLLKPPIELPMRRRKRILVEVYSSAVVTDHFEEIFTEINKAEPIKWVDMPGVVSKGDRKTTTGAASKLQDRYYEMFKPSQFCRPPHFNIVNFHDALFAAEFIKKHNLKSSKH